ncbi:MAG: hypothetical protein WCT04_17680 [Planctomycetota bacterium]
MRSFMAGIGLALLVMCSATHATSVNDIVLGKREFGTNLAPKDLKGKVVMVVFWGTH